MKNRRNPRNIEKIRRRNFFVLLFQLLLYGFGISVFSIVYVPFLYDFTGSIVITGFITTLGIIIQYLPMPMIGRLADKYGRKLIWYFDTPFMVLGLLMFIVANNLFILIAGVLCYSVGTMIGISIFKVFVTENSTETKQ